MEPMLLLKPEFDQVDRDLLKDIAFQSICHGLAFGEPLPVDPTAYSDLLQENRACFVTLKYHGQLRGCMGTLDPDRPLVEDVARNAFNAAFRDRRFEPLEKWELEGLAFHLSVLSPKEPLNVSSDRDLLNQLRPGVDGLVLEWGKLGATFLPVMWKQLPNPADFLSHLKLKAGIPPTCWDRDFHFYRYTAEEF